MQEGFVMKVLYKWENCEAFGWATKEYAENNGDAYFVEIPKDEVSEKLFSLFIENSHRNPDELRNGEYYDDVNNWGNPDLATRNCAYVLIDKNVTKAILCDVYYPYSGQWGAYCPFKYLYQTNMQVKEYRKYCIHINDLEELKLLDKLIEEGNYSNV
jgi:hypothetical protein